MRDKLQCTHIDYLEEKEKAAQIKSNLTANMSKVVQSKIEAVIN